MLVRMSEEDPDYEGKWPEGDAMSERVLVPREPTPEMIRAGWPTAAPDWVVEALYRAMLDAAPAAPQMTDEEMDDAVKRDEAEQERAHIAYLRGIEEGKRQAAAPQRAEPVAQIGWADEFGNLFPMGAWKPTQRTHHDSHKTAWRAVYLHPPAAEVQRLARDFHRLQVAATAVTTALYDRERLFAVAELRAALAALEGGE